MSEVEFALDICSKCTVSSKFYVTFMVIQFAVPALFVIVISISQPMLSVFVPISLVNLLKFEALTSGKFL